MWISYQNQARKPSTKRTKGSSVCEKKPLIEGLFCAPRSHDPLGASSSDVEDFSEGPHIRR